MMTSDSGNYFFGAPTLYTSDLLVLYMQMRFVVI